MRPFCFAAVRRGNNRQHLLTPRRVKGVIGKRARFKI